MATPIIDALSKDLAYKLQDPVTSGTANGARISAAERFRYILRGYRRLVRVVTLLYPTLANRLLKKQFLVDSGDTNGLGIYPLGVYNQEAEIFEVLAKEPAQETYARATYVLPEDWNSVTGSINIFYIPDLNTRSYFWTLMDNKIRLSPPASYNLQISMRLDRAASIETGGQGGTYDIDLPTEQLDLILAAAATEAYLDIGQPDLANANLSDFMSQLQLLTANTQEDKAKNEV
jgi:hypothetical protein